VVINDDLDHAVATVTAIIEGEQRRIGRRVDIAGQVEAIRREIAAEALKLE